MFQDLMTTPAVQSVGWVVLLALIVSVPILIIRRFWLQSKAHTELLRQSLNEDRRRFVPPVGDSRTPAKPRLRA